MQDSWPQFNPNNSSVMLLDSDDYEVQLVSYSTMLTDTVNDDNIKDDDDIKDDEEVNCDGDAQQI